jgi:hypothetical protein
MINQRRFMLRKQHSYWKLFWTLAVVETLILLAFPSSHGSARILNDLRIDGPYITVIYQEPINVRSGPNTAYYPIVGRLSPGDTAPAIGRTPGSEWIQISYLSAPGNVGWVYSNYVTLTGGTPPVVPTPNPPMPLITPTIDSALLTALAPLPTNTRLPTFTPPPTVEIPTFAPVNNTILGFQIAPLIIGAAALGILGLLISFLFRRR